MWWPCSSTKSFEGRPWSSRMSLFCILLSLRHRHDPPLALPRLLLGRHQPPHPEHLHPRLRQHGANLPGRLRPDRLHLRRHGVRNAMPLRHGDNEPRPLSPRRSVTLLVRRMDRRFAAAPTRSVCMSLCQSGRVWAATPTRPRRTRWLSRMTLPGTRWRSARRPVKREGYLYAGMEFGTQCFCGNSFDNGGVLTSGCATPCAGDSTEVCGGSKTLSMYYLFQ